MADGLLLTAPAAALGIAVLHTAAGPDHYLPFVALAHAREWSRARVVAVTAACGVAHVLSSLLIGTALVLVGASLGWLERIELHRGTAAGWALVVFGGTYALWGAWRARPGHHGHTHHHDGGKSLWALFLVFVLGPCEPLIPLVFLPAAEGRWLLAISTAAIFSVATVLTMIVLVGLARAGTRHLPHAFLNRWSHGAAGLLLVLSGVAVLVGL